MLVIIGVLLVGSICTCSYCFTPSLISTFAILLTVLDSLSAKAESRSHKSSGKTTCTLGDFGFPLDECCRVATTHKEYWLIIIIQGYARIVSSIMLALDSQLVFLVVRCKKTWAFHSLMACIYSVIASISPL